jgi:hypothetical protein
VYLDQYALRGSAKLLDVRDQQRSGGSSRRLDALRHFAAGVPERP